MTDTTCSACAGTGDQFGDYPCDRCDGRGTVESADVMIPRRLIQKFVAYYNLMDHAQGLPDYWDNLDRLVEELESRAR